MGAVVTCEMCRSPVLVVVGVSFVQGYARVSVQIVNIMVGPRA